MVILTFFYENGLWLSWPAFGLGVYLFWFFIMTVVRLGSRNRICSLPLEAEQRVEFNEAGEGNPLAGGAAVHHPLWRPQL